MSDAARPAPGPRPSEETRVARHAGKVAGATMLSRVLGLVREQVMAGFFGAGFATDAFNVGFRIPNLLRDLFAEGALSAAFVPTFTEYDRKRAPGEAWELGRQVFLHLLAVMLVVCVLGYLGMPWIVRAFAPGFAAVPGKLDLTVLLSRWMLPFLPLVAFAALAAGMLNARRLFLAPALAPAVLNVGMILGGVTLIPVCVELGLPWPGASCWGGPGSSSSSSPGCSPRGSGSGGACAGGIRAWGGWRGSCSRPRSAWPPPRSTCWSAR